MLSTQVRLLDSAVNSPASGSVRLYVGGCELNANVRVDMIVSNFIVNNLKAIEMFHSKTTNVNFMVVPEYKSVDFILCKTQMYQNVPNFMAVHPKPAEIPLDQSFVPNVQPCHP